MHGISKFSHIGFVVIAIAVIGGSFTGGMWYGYTNRPAVEKVLNVTGQTPPKDLEGVDFDLFWDVWARLEDKFVDKEKINRQELVYGAAEGIARALKDPYTEFLPPPETKQFQEDIKGAFEGIGAEIGIRKGTLTIIAPLKGMPAEKVGLKAGDKIIKIDDKLTADLALDEAVRLIRGKGGTKVKLTIIRDGLDKTKEYTVIRDTIRVQVLTTEKRENGIFVIKLHTFTENAGYEFRKAVQEFFESGSKKLVFDLRNNPGGFLLVSVDIASWFIPSGDIVARERYANGKEDIYRSSGYHLLENIPTVVLINEGSASASEIVAGALRDVKNIKLIGNKTFGKGSVQEVQNLSGGSSLKITIAKWHTPKGLEINGTGLEPDIKVELPPSEDQDPKIDLILEKGVEILKGL